LVIFLIIKECTVQGTKQLLPPSYETTNTGSTGTVRYFLCLMQVTRLQSDHFALNTAPLMKTGVKKSTPNLSPPMNTFTRLRHYIYCSVVLVHFEVRNGGLRGPSLNGNTRTLAKITRTTAKKTRRPLTAYILRCSNSNATFPFQNRNFARYEVHGSHNLTENIRTFRNFINDLRRRLQTRTHSKTGSSVRCV
jgi:hypothetical protein